ncbi:type III-A CRISPR-associated RAMP protein Csm3 [Azohydromonas sediminis]|uniref:type III-A CRISPR-associated RAMP protein Csm3 n=1 Tax=Azohydromonas sediminis TaxID=2259674 RepID=UPI000E65AC29|nr:type III-A CRISPR-associated RAMP protein Csm3 [Azohydromonas sediminis]
MPQLQLLRIQQLTGTLELLSGLRIGASEGEIRIGGVDNQVIRNAHDRGKPYIPGSSLKGKVRSLLEWRSGAVRPEPLGIRDLSDRHPLVRPILQLFGVGGGDQLSEEQAADLGPTRVAFWDAQLRPEWVERIERENLPLTEVKTENRINRICGVAEHPRQTERVPAGAVFDFRLSIRVLNTDAEAGAALRRTLLQGLRLLELDSLGGSGSRGYGKVRLRGLQLDGADLQAEFDAIDPFAA